MNSRTVAVVTDSTAYMPKELLDKYGICFASTVVNWGNETYKDAVDITSSAFFERLKTDPVAPTTAAASIGDLRDLYAKAAETADAVVGIHISSKLSAVYSAAVQAKEMLPGKKIEVIDSESAAMATGFTVLAAARAAEAGGSFDQVVQAARSTIPHTGVMFTVETLEYLRRGGRIGGAAAFVGGLLNLKPILYVRDGVIEPLERVRTKRKALDRILEVIAERTQGKEPLRLATIHAAAPDEASELLELAKKRLGATESYLAEASPSVAAHTGPGTVGLAWCAGV